MGKGREASRWMIELFLPLSVMCAKGGVKHFFQLIQGGGSHFFHIFEIFHNDETIFLLLGPLFEVFCLVIGDLKGQFMMVILAIFRW